MDRERPPHQNGSFLADLQDEEMPQVPSNMNSSVAGVIHSSANGYTVHHTAQPPMPSFAGPGAMVQPLPDNMMLLQYDQGQQLPAQQVQVAMQQSPVQELPVEQAATQTSQAGKIQTERGRNGRRGRGDGGYSEQPYLPSYVDRDNRQPCVVCEEICTGKHYQQLSCEGCKGFFRRTNQEKNKYTCTKGGNCTIVGKLGRNKCKACRYQKCLDKGMCPDLVMDKEDRERHNKVKEENRKKRDDVAKMQEQQEKMEALALSQEHKDLLTAIHKAFAGGQNTDGHQPVLIAEEAWQRIADILAACVANFTTFVGLLPGFIDLDVEDQCLLMKEGFLEVVAVYAASNYNPAEDSLVTLGGHKLFRATEEQVSSTYKAFTKSFFNTVKGAAGIPAEELALLAARSVFASSRPGLKNKDAVDKIETEISELMNTRRTNIFATNLKLVGVAFYMRQKFLSVKMMKERDVPSMLVEILDEGDVIRTRALGTISPATVAVMPNVLTVLDAYPLTHGALPTPPLTPPQAVVRSKNSPAKASPPPAFHTSPYMLHYSHHSGPPYLTLPPASLPLPSYVPTTHHDYLDRLMTGASTDFDNFKARNALAKSASEFYNARHGYQPSTTLPAPGTCGPLAPNSIPGSGTCGPFAPASVPGSGTCGPCAPTSVSGSGTCGPLAPTSVPGSGTCGPFAPTSRAVPGSGTCGPFAPTSVPGSGTCGSFSPTSRAVPGSGTCGPFAPTSRAVPGSGTCGPLAPTSVPAPDTCRSYVPSSVSMPSPQKELSVSSTYDTYQPLCSPISDVESDSPMDDGPITKGPTADGPIAKGPIANGPIDDGPIDDGPIDDGPIDLPVKKSRTSGNFMMDVILRVPQTLSSVQSSHISNHSPPANDDNLQMLADTAEKQRDP